MDMCTDITCETGNINLYNVLGGVRHWHVYRIKQRLLPGQPEELV